MNVLPSHLEFVAIPDAVIRIATLPHRQLRAQSMGEAPFDQSHNTLKRNSLRTQQQMNVIRHDDKGV